MEKNLEKKREDETQIPGTKYSLKEIEQGWQEYLSRTPQEREELKDPFQFKDRDLHLNQCLQVVPDQFREKVKYAEQDSGKGYEVMGDHLLQLRLFLASERARYPTMKDSSTWS